MSLVLLFSLLPILSHAADLSTITAAPQATGLNVRTISVGSTTYETTSPLPLTEYLYPYDQLPYQINPYPIGRGPQSGYNQCNSTTEGEDSQCQTVIMNTIDDFCLWGAPDTTPDQTIGDTEAAVVAYCTKAGHGARILPPGSLTAVQFMRTEAYIQIVGFINQTALNLAPNDTGGELDPHGDDQLGNPLGGAVYSTQLPSGDNTTYLQTNSWTLFVGSDTFCFKLCDPSYNATDLNYCQNIFDLLGCSQNMPAAYEPGVFLACDGELQDEVGTYTSNGQTYTWSQPSSLDPTSTLPWKPRIPASSNCVYYQSTDLYPTESLGYQSTATPLVDSGLTTTPATVPSTFGTISQTIPAASAASATSAAGGVISDGSVSPASSGSSGSSIKSAAAASGSSSGNATSDADLGFQADLVGGLAGLAGLAIGLVYVLP